MSELQKKYKQFSNISKHWFPRIKKIFINSRIEPYLDIHKWDVIFTTKDNQVHGFGDYIYAVLGENLGAFVIIPTVIEELCGKDIKKVEFGDEFMVVLTESHELFTSGNCLKGRCGNGRNSDTYCKPQKILIEDQLVVDICCGVYYTLVLTDKQQVYAFGSLDFLWSNVILSPTLMCFESEKITSISCAYWHALALTQTGKVYAWGSNELGQLGLGYTNESENNPKLVILPNNVSVKQISCGKDFSLLLTTDGNIYSFGRNKHGQLGLNSPFDVMVPTLISTSNKFTEILAHNFQSFAMNESNGIEFWGQNIVGECVRSPQPINVSSLQEAVIQYMWYPFTIEPIIMNNDPVEALGEAIEKNCQILL